MKYIMNYKNRADIYLSDKIYGGLEYDYNNIKIKVISGH